MNQMIEHLISAYLDGVLTDEQQRELAEWIEADPENAKQFAEAVLLDNQLRAEVNVRHYKSLPDTSSRTSWFNIAATLAVVVLVWMNLSLSATTGTDFRVKSAANALEVDQSTAEIRELLPELSAHEARRQARLLRSLDNLIVRPEPPPPSFTQRSPNGLGRLSQ